MSHMDCFYRVILELDSPSPSLIKWKWATSIFFKISFLFCFVFYRMKKVMQVWLWKWWLNLQFWDNSPFRMRQNVQYWVLQQPVLEVPHSITQYSLWVLTVSALHQREKLMHTTDWDDRDAHVRTHFPPFWQSKLHTNHNQHYQPST